MKQRCPDLSFQVLDLLAERQLADANLGRRPREMPLLGDSQKISDVAQFHGHLPNRSQLPLSHIGPMEAQFYVLGQDNPSCVERAIARIYKGGSDDHRRLRPNDFQGPWARRWSG